MKREYKQTNKQKTNVANILHEMNKDQRFSLYNNNNNKKLRNGKEIFENIRK